MNTDNTENIKADALSALAAQAARADDGQEASPAPQADGTDADTGQEPAVPAPPEAQTGEQDPFGKLAAAAEAPAPAAHDQPPENHDAQDFLNQMAQQSEIVSPELSQLRAMTGGCAEVTAGDWVTPTELVTPSAPAIRPSQRSARLQANTRRMHSQSFKQTMIPLLLVVGGLLILFCVVTGVMLVNEGFTPEYGPPSGLQAYGKYFIVAALPIGAILIMGAWLFYLDVRKSTAGRRK